MSQGLDSAASTLGSLIAAKNAGFTSAGRYLWRGGKGVTPRELRAQAAVFGGSQPSWLVYEAGAQDVLSGAAGGRTAGVRIEELFRALGLPDTIPIYGVAVDFPADDGELDAIAEYARGLRDTIRPSRPLGAYGEGAVHQDLLGSATTLAWVWGANETAGTPDFLASKRWHIHQHVPQTGFGIEYDPDELAEGDFGGFRVPVLMQPGDHGDDIRLLQHHVGLTGPAVDGSFGPQTAAALGRWLAARALPQRTLVDDELWTELTHG